MKGNLRRVIKIEMRDGRRNIRSSEMMMKTIKINIFIKNII